MIRLTAFTLVAILLLAANTGFAQTTRPAITLEFWTIRLAPDYGHPRAASPADPRWGFVNDLIRAYEKKRPGIRIRWEDKPCDGFGCESYEKDFLAKYLGGTPPDIVNANTFIALRLAARGALLPVPQSLAKDFEKHFWQLAEYRGNTWALPWYVGPQVLIYNADIFRRAGFDPAKPPKTQQELVQTAKLIKDRTGIYGFWPNVEGLRMLIRFQEEGLPVLDAAKKKALFNSPAHAAMLRLYIDLYQNDYYSSDVFVLGFDGAVDKFSRGEVAMIQIGPQFLTRIQRSGPAVFSNTRIAPYPKGNGNVIESPVMNLVVPKKTRHPKEAMDFAAFVTNETNQMAFASYVSPRDGIGVVLFPSAKLTDPAHIKFFAQSAGQDPYSVARRIGYQSLAAGRDFTPTLPILHKDYIALRDIFVEAMEAARFGTRTAQEALDFAVKEWNKILSRP